MQTLLRSPATRKRPGVFTVVRRATPAGAMLRSRPRESQHAGRTDEHRHAFAQLRAAALDLELRVGTDPGGWPAIPGRYGVIEWHDDDRFAAFTTRRLIRGRLLAIPGVVTHQVGDDELRVLFPIALLPTVAALLRARRRRRGRPLTPEAAANLRRSGRVTAALAPQELAEAGFRDEIAG
jgi:hypothetical protein